MTVDGARDDHARMDEAENGNGNGGNGMDPEGSCGLRVDVNVAVRKTEDHEDRARLEHRERRAYHERHECHARPYHP